MPVAPCAPSVANCAATWVRRSAPISVSGTVMSPACAENAVSWRAVSSIDREYSAELFSPAPTVIETGTNTSEPLLA